MLQINEAMVLVLEANSRDVVMQDLGISSPLISTWKVAHENHIIRFPVAVKIYGIYNIVVYPYDEGALRDEWHKLEIAD